ncbi:MAG: hypothetical protein IJM96_03850 [Clostridia bacterium]|nr:hypothetical protein [Clostridia bacterium]
MENKLELLEKAKLSYKEGIDLYFAEDADDEQKTEGFRKIKWAALAHYPAAMYVYGVLLVSGREGLDTPDRIDKGLGYIWTAERKGIKRGRKFLDDYCRTRYNSAFARKLKTIPPMPLVGFDGKPIKINRVSKLTPIDVKLDYINGENILNIGANLEFVPTETQLPDEAGFYDAVIRGIKAWEGEYIVFGGQKLKVKVNISTEDRLFDKIYIMPVTNDVSDMASKVADFMGGQRKERVKSIINNKRSAAGIGIRKWTIRSRKMILVQSANGRFDDFDEITSVAKHEFGHVLGLGDLYQSKVDGFPGVPKGTYKELDAYYINNKFYNLVMCDERGIISNNDIEMVVLAFQNNEMQHYQQTPLKGVISRALGKGN